MGIGGLRLEVETRRTFSQAAHQNSYPLVRQLMVKCPKGRAEEDGSADPVDSEVRGGFEVRMTADQVALGGGGGRLVEDRVWKVPGGIRPGQTVSVPPGELRFDHSLLGGVTDEVETCLRFALALPGGEAASPAVERPVTVLPANHWGGEGRQTDLLPAFVRPTGAYVDSLVRQVSETLERAGHDGALDGYQSGTRERPYLAGSALWNVVWGERLAYVSPPPGFAESGQRILSPAEIASGRMAACLDSSLLFAGCLERMGLNPVVAMTKGHAFAGFWLVDTCFPLLTNDDPMDLRKRMDMDDLVLFETTLVTGKSPVTFEEAREEARRLVAVDNEEEFVCLVDIRQARKRMIRPLASVEEREREKERREAERKAGAEGLPLPPPPPLPRVRPEEDTAAPETPESRVGAWERRLLDLTKRNRFLNLSSRATSVPIYCPDIGALEDLLAQGRRFSFLSAEKGPFQDAERDGDLFRLATGNDLHEQYATEQLAGGVLVASQDEKRLERSTLELMRKAKADLEEGGSNTLFLAMGMLRWKDTPKDKRPCRAPLLLLPVRLTRKSARAKIHLERLEDEEPLFNPTLLEFLHQQHEIDLFRLAEGLPEDEHGVDVKAVWEEVRRAVAEQEGFEVTEELVLASLSFAKYLMWKDLRDRVGDLKSNPFVEHLIERPGEQYRQDTSVLSPREVDEKVDPKGVFTPLNCDSAQLVAVEASGHAQDFILEGPPGTGKSETIANIICHNLALGRKVLFVAEKMAALSVVHQRIVKVGLDHLCLELHSNKANKKAVLEQLRRAWDARKEAHGSGWEEEALRLKDLRDSLNAYVEELHRKSALGLSPYDAVARLVQHGERHRLELGWGPDIGSAPVRDEKDVGRYLEAAERLASAHRDVADLDAEGFAAVERRDWSNRWQGEFAGKVGELRGAAEALRKAADAFAKEAGLEVGADGPESAGRLGRLAAVVGFALSHRIGYALRDGAGERLEKLASLADRKRDLDRLLGEVGAGLTAEKASTLPAEEWKAAKDRAVAKGFLGFFALWGLRKAPVQFGLGKVADLSRFDRLAEAKALCAGITADLAEFEADRVWSGWDTPHEELSAAAQRGKDTVAAIASMSGLTKDLAGVRERMRRLLVEQRDFLDESSPLAKAKDALEAAWKEWEGLLGSATESGFRHREGASFADVASSCDFILGNEAKLNRWCLWLAQADSARAAGLGRLVDGLLGKEILPDDAKGEAGTALCRWLAPLLIDASDTLRKFSTSRHEDLIAKFREIDRHVAETTGAHISAIAAGTLPDPDAPDAPEEFGILARELNKKSRHKPLRTLAREMGGRLTDLTPCLMMSPLSVAQFLPSDMAGFDLVLFDEASQITPWDAVGAIARGKNVIVVGDPKQMPPTNFFSGAPADEDADEADVESILDQALFARLPHLRLTGHYRSRHESLIAFSNSQYYENSLTTYPAAQTRASAVTLMPVEGLYSKGKAANNPKEAKAVADEVVRRLKDPELRKRSIGVVALNMSQKRTIEDFLEEARRKHPGIDRFFEDGEGHDPVFVKNLESVQGDERDVIILSLGFGPTEPGAKAMSMNFGPLNREGGERRLNVAITRSRHDMLVFSSFDHSMIDLSRTKATAVEHLKHYLKFAEEGPEALASIARATHGVDQFDSEFERMVAADLRARGWKAQTQVGVGKFRIDLGITHPDMPGKYLAGVECDGYTYHSSPAARDRDRIRHVVLENLGWNLVRLWSIDYFNDPKGAMDRVHRELEGHLETSRAQARAEDNLAELRGEGTPASPEGGSTPV